MLEQARAALQPARDAIEQARANLRHGLHSRARWEFCLQSVNLGAAAAMMIATASQHSDLQRDRQALVMPTPEELAAAESAFAKEFA
jgi:hypothetical protein